MLDALTILRLEAEIERIYGEIELELVTAVAKQLAVGTDLNARQWLQGRVGATASVRVKLQKVLVEGNKARIKEIDTAVETAFRDAALADDVVFRQAADVLSTLKDTGYVHGIGTEAYKTRLQAAIRNARTSLNLTNTRALEAATSMYVNAINDAYVRTMSGTTTLQQAVAKACKTLGGRGVVVTYASDTGKITRRSLDASIRSDIVTSINQSACAYTAERCGDYGTDLVETSAHAGSRPEHAAWQGKVFSLSGKTKGYRTLAEATGYGRPDGLCGVNCRHSFFPYFPGLSKQTDHDDLPGKKENDRLYAQTQTQRKYERTIRKYKREGSAAQAAGDAQGQAQAKARLDATYKDFRTFMKTTDLRRRYDREIG